MSFGGNLWLFVYVKRTVVWWCSPILRSTLWSNIMYWSPVMWCTVCTVLSRYIYILRCYKKKLSPVVHTWELSQQDTNRDFQDSFVNSSGRCKDHANASFKLQVATILKGQFHEIFHLNFSSWNISALAPDWNPSVNLHMVSNSWRYSNSNIFLRCWRQRR
jgi:hypothetical protein